MTTFINLTPHDLTVNEDIFLASGTVARVTATRQEAPTIGGFRLVRQSFGQVQNLPESQPDTVYIVSALVLSALGGSRADVVAPDTGADAIRKDGQIVAVRGFVH